MSGLTSRQPGIRSAMKAGIAATILVMGATWLVAGGTNREGGRPLVVAQATPAPSSTPAAGATAFDSAQRAAIGDIVKAYLLEHPEVMLEVQTALEAKMEKLQSEKLKLALETNAREIYHSSSAPAAGNSKGDIPVVEFFDYNCGYCKRAFTDIAKLIDDDKNIRLILKEFPILSKGSEEASKLALAAAKQEKYWEVHRALIAIRGEVNEQSSLRAIEKISGIDMAKLKADAGSPEISGEIKRVKELASKMGIQGTPHFLVGDRAIPGAPTDLLDQIKSYAADLRKAGGCSVC